MVAATSFRTDHLRAAHWHLHDGGNLPRSDWQARSPGRPRRYSSRDHAGRVDFPGTRNWVTTACCFTRRLASMADLTTCVRWSMRHISAVSLSFSTWSTTTSVRTAIISGAYSRDYFNPGTRRPWGDGLNFELKPVRTSLSKTHAIGAVNFTLTASARRDARDRGHVEEAHVLAEIAEVGALVKADSSPRKTSATNHSSCSRPNAVWMGLTRSVGRRFSSCRPRDA